MIMKPWYVAAVSAGVLTANTFTIEGHLSPGFCPRNPTLNIYEKYKL